MKFAYVSPATADRVRTALDWTVFSVGVLSLTTAIAATVLTHMDMMPVKTAAASEEISVATLPDVL